MKDSQSPSWDKVVVAVTAFSCSCAAFMVSLLVLIPVFGMLGQRFQLPELMQQITVMVLLFGTPVLGALVGLQLGERMLASDETSPTV